MKNFISTHNFWPLGPISIPITKSVMERLQMANYSKCWQHSYGNNTYWCVDCLRVYELPIYRMRTNAKNTTKNTNTSYLLGLHL